MARSGMGLAFFASGCCLAIQFRCLCSFNARESCREKSLSSVIPSTFFAYIGVAQKSVLQNEPLSCQLGIARRTMFFSPKAWFIIFGVFAGVLGLVFNWEAGLPNVSYLSSEDALIRRNLAERAAQYVALELSQQKPLSDGRPIIAIANGVDDYQGLVTKELKTWFARRNVRVLNQNRLFSLANLYQTRPATIAESVSPFLNGTAEYVLVAQIDNWTTYPEYQAKLIGTIYLYDREGFELTRICLTPDNTANTAGAERRLMPTEQAAELSNVTDEKPAGHFSELESSKANQPRRSRHLFENEPGMQPEAASLVSLFIPMSHLGILGWMGFVLAAPWVLAKPIKRILYRRDNRANAKMLGAWGVICAGAFWFLMTFGGVSIVTTVISLFTGVLCCWYFALVCEKLERTL